MVKENACSFKAPKRKKNQKLNPNPKRILTRKKVLTNTITTSTTVSTTVEVTDRTIMQDDSDQDVSFNFS